MDIRNHMYKATLKQMLCKVDQINLEEKIKTWEQEDPENHFFFRPCSLSPTGGVSKYCSNPDGHVEAQIIQNLLFAHQTAWQRHLISTVQKEVDRPTRLLQFVAFYICRFLFGLSTFL